MLQTWSRVSKCYLLPEHPFALHALLYKAVYRGWHTNLQVMPFNAAAVDSAYAVADKRTALRQH